MCRSKDVRLLFLNDNDCNRQKREKLTLAELIRGITPETVSTQAFRYAPGNWTTYADLPASLRAAGYTEQDLENGFSVSRQQLKELFATALKETPEQLSDMGRLAAAVTVVPVWGYPRGVVGPGNRLPIEAVHEHREALAQSMADFAFTPADTAQIVTAATYRNIGLSTLSKLLYFAGLVSEEGPMLIYDQMVMRSLHYHRFDEYGNWPAYSGQAQRATYAQFIRRTAAAAALLGVAPEVIEYALFKEGQRLGKDFKLPELDEADEELPSAEREIGPVVKRTAGDASIERLPTFGGDSEFTAEFYANGDVRLRYGALSTKLVKKDIFERITSRFQGTAVPLTAKVGPSLNEWLLDNLSKTRLASYIGSVLIRQDYVVRKGELLCFPAKGAN